jgi:hypothetical protein
MSRIFLYLLLALATSAARADWIETSNGYAIEVLKQQAKFVPELASSYGLSQFDSEVIDLGPRVDERKLALYRAVEADLRKSLAQEREPRVRQDLEIILGSVHDDISAIDLERRYLLPYIDLHEFLFRTFSALLDPRNDASRYPAAVERLQKYTGQAEGYTPLTEQAMARTGERFAREALLGPYRGELEEDLASAPVLLDGLRSAFEGSELEGWQEPLALLEAQLAGYERWLRDTLLPRSREDNRLPEPLYINELRNYGVTDTPAALMAQGQFSYQLTRSQMKALARQIAAQRGWQETGLLAVIRRLKEERIPQDELLSLYRKRLSQLEEIIRREKLVTLPERDAVIRNATEAEAAAVPASFMKPPQLIDNTGQYGEFVLVQRNPNLGEKAAMDDWSHDAITWALTAHEARPGHELQFARLVEDGTSLARAIFASNSANAEGWGLYAESIMQPYLPLEGQLFSLYSRLMRAARMFLDPMVNTGLMTRDEARVFLEEQVALSHAMASSEADRYAFRAPGQATSYYFGYVGLMRLRTEVEVALGANFDRQAFHDFILRQGLLPPDLLREAVMANFLP